MVRALADVTLKQIAATVTRRIKNTAALLSCEPWPVADFLAKDVGALERLVGSLLNHLERAIDPNVTDQERAQFHTMINEIRGALA